jgi:2-polyprenyl-6-methoxyphenol hydroxylase-like FAD-dependent oxidoreductase
MRLKNMAGNNRTMVLSSFPAGGFGMNTCIQDAHNLIWQIAFALQSDDTDLCESTERLSASYEGERRPVVRLKATISVQNFEKTRSTDLSGR